VSEVDYLNGAVVRHGERCGIKTPLNRFLNETLLALASGELPLETYTRRPDLLLQRISQAG
jgi:2-dehydropantoate 2-reductase